MEIDIYQYLVDNNLLEDFVKNFSVTRNIKLINKIRVLGYAYYEDNLGTGGHGRVMFDKIPLPVYRWIYGIDTFYVLHGHHFESSEVKYGEGVDEKEIPLKVNGFYDSSFSNLEGYEAASYMDNYSKRTLVKCGKSSHFVLPIDLKELLKNDKDFAKCVYMFYTLKGNREVDNDDVLSIKRIVEIDKEINQLKIEKDSLMESMTNVLTL